MNTVTFLAKRNPPSDFSKNGYISVYLEDSEGGKLCLGTCECLMGVARIVSGYVTADCVFEIKYSAA